MKEKIKIIFSKFDFISIHLRYILITLYSLVILFIVLNIFLSTLSNKYRSEIIKPKSDTFSVLAASLENKAQKYIVYGFLPYWSLDQAEYFQLDKLTDISYFALQIEKDGSIRKILDDGTIDPGYYSWRNSKNLENLINQAQKHNVKFAVTIISHEDEISDYFLNCRSCWSTFISELENEMGFRDIKDVNLDFEYVEYADEDIANKYTEFVGFVNKELDARHGNSFVVVSTFADALIKPRITNPSDLSKAADGLFLMAYDFHRPTSDNAGPIAPIGGAGTYHEYDMQTMLQDYMAVAPTTKLILGVPYYGYNWVVNSYQPYAIRLIGNDYIGYSLSQRYADVMETQLEYRPQILWDEIAQAPYFTYVSNKTGSIRQVYFENIDSLRIKYRLAKDLNLAGVGIWALGYDRGYQELWKLLSEEFPE